MPAPKQDPATLSLSEATFAMDATPDRCVLLDATGCIVRANESWTKSSRQTDVVPLENAREGADDAAAGSGARRSTAPFWHERGGS